MKTLRFVLAFIAFFVMSTALAGHVRPSAHRHSQWITPPKLTLASNPVDCMAMAMYREARGESDRGMIGVGYVILKRTKAGKRYFADNVCGVVTQSVRSKGRTTRVCQFSWACTPLRYQKVKLAQFQRAQMLAILVLAEAVPNPVGDALYFHGVRDRHKPSRHAQRTARIGGHAFFADYRIYHSTVPNASAPTPVDGELAAL